MLGRKASGVVVAPQPVAVEEGAKVLMAGGNAIDAAVVCALVQGILSPHSCGIGGYAVLTAHMGGESLALDAPARAGSLVRPDMWHDAVLGPNPGGWGFFLRGKVNDIGYTSICTPGTVRALSSMLDAWGTLSWGEALEPARSLAADGFVVSEHLASGWKQPPGYPEGSSPLQRVLGNPEASRVYLHEGGRPYEAGETLRNPDYARSLERLAANGADDFYHGDMAAEMARDLAAHGAFVTAEDLDSYQMRDVEPVTGTYRGYAIATSPAPHGGPTLVAALNILEGYDLAALGHNSPAYIHLVAMAMKAAFADRNPHLADPDFCDVPLEWMTSKERAAFWRDEIDAGRDIRVSFLPPEPPDTTHVSIVDAFGNCVALTHSLGSSSGVITPGMGFMYNDSMVNFYPYAGHPNSIAPHKSRTSGMTPTIAYKDGQPVMVIGAPGATRIITSNLQVMLNVLDFRMDVGHAVWAPRFDCQGDVIRCHARIPEFVCAEVRRRHPIERIPQSHGGFALVHAVTIDPATGRVAGAADPGAGGMALVV